MILLLLLCINLFAEDGQQNNNLRYNSIFYVSDCNFENINLKDNSKFFVKKFEIVNFDSCSLVSNIDDLRIIGYSISDTSIISHNLPEISEDNPLILPPEQFKEFEITINPTKSGEINEKIIFYNEEGNYYNSEYINSPRTIIPEIEAQNYDFGEIPLNTESNVKVYSPEDSELITVYNLGNEVCSDILEIRGINFEGVKGPVGTNNGLSAFSFDEEFKNVLPEIPNNYFGYIKLAPGSSSLRHSVYFKPMVVGDYEINYYFNNNAEPEGEETRYTIKAKVINPNSDVRYNKNNLNFYPNPADEFIRFSDKSINKVEIYNLLGEKILEKENLFNEKSIDISNLQSGVYFLKIFRNSDITIEKIIVN